MLTGPIPSAAGVVYLRTGPFAGTPHPAPRRQWLIMLRGAVKVARDGRDEPRVPGR